jgi:hypothetical protein
VFGTPQMPHSAILAEFSLKEQIAQTHIGPGGVSGKVSVGDGTGCSVNTGKEERVGSADEVLV